MSPVRGSGPSSRPRAGEGPDPLAPYRAKRDFARTSEPDARVGSDDAGRFVVQKHAARRLHYDLRLELDGVLKSWAVTRGPSLVSGDRRLAVRTEDHPVEYLDFEGVIPTGEYGGGTMIVWDRGTWTPEGDPRKGLAKGHLSFTLHGERLGGGWHLVRMKPRPRERTEQWLLLKSDDTFARPPDDPALVETVQTSVASGLTNDELAAAGPLRSDHASRAAARRSPAATSGTRPARRSGSAEPRKALLPVFVEPALATLADAPPVGDDWLHEIKFDGYRLQARIDGDRVRLLTRSGLDWTERFPALVEPLRGLRAGSALLDGEVVVEDDSGVSSFQTLQADLSDARSDRMVLHLFDLLYLDGRDWRGEPLADRKDRLAALIAQSDPARLRYSDHMVGDGAAMARHACRLGLEGIICKRRDAPYRSGRTGTWLKVKCTVSEDVVIAGYVPSSTSTRAVGSLVVGQWEAGRLVHVGRVGTGFGRDVAEALRTMLDAARRPAPPFDGTLPAGAARGVRWTEPALVAEVDVRGRTADGLLRHASFKGLRDDKAPADAVREGSGGGTAMTPRRTRTTPVPADRPDGAAKRGRARRVAPPATPTSPSAPELTHPDRVYWPEEGITKEGLADYHAAVADLILPHVVGRPLALVRCPGGIGEGCFFQKHAWAGMAGPIRQSTIGDDAVLSIDDADGLFALVQAGVLEIHPWGARLDDPERPDRVVIDLDPDEGLDWGFVVEAAHEVRRRLAAMGLVGFAKTTGGKGLHVVVPLARDAGWDRVKGFAEELARAMAGDAPDRFTATAAKAARKGRIYVDWLRNARGATAVAAYSPRARPHAAVSTPLTWDELSPAVRPGQFTIRTLPGRIAHLAADPWEGIDALDQRLPAATARRRGRR